MHAHAVLITGGTGKMSETLKLCSVVYFLPACSDERRVRLQLHRHRDCVVPREEHGLNLLAQVLLLSPPS